MTRTPAVSVQVCLTTSAGAEVGGSLAEIGEVIYSVGSLGEIFLDFAMVNMVKQEKKVSMCLDEN